MLCCILAAGCRSEPSDQTAVLRVALDTGPLTLDPRFATDATASQIADLLFDGLTQLDEQSRRVPHVARSWDTPDAQTYVFHLADGFRFRDQQPLTAADVKATYDAVRDPNSRSPKQQALAAIESIDVIDPLTVRFRLRAPLAPFLDETGLGILPAREVARSPDRALALPTGTGPYRLLDFRADEAVTLAANPSYPLGAPRIGHIEFAVVPDAVTRLLELRRGSIDLVQNSIEPDALGWLRRQAHIAVLTGASTSFQYIGLNMREPPLADVRVRQALAYAIDRAVIVRTLLKGLATVATGLLPPSHWAYSSQVATYAYNPQRAAELLDAAGHPDPDGRGRLPRFRLSYKTSTIELRRRIAEVLQQELAAVGIGLDVRSYEWATFYDDIKRGNFQLYSLAWVGIEDPDIYFETCNSSQTPPAGNNRGNFHDESIDALTDAARHTTDVDERRRLYAEVQSRWAQLLPAIPLWWPTNVVALRTRVHGYELRSNGSYAGLKDAWIEEEP